MWQSDDGTMGEGHGSAYAGTLALHLEDLMEFLLRGFFYSITVTKKH